MQSDRELNTPFLIVFLVVSAFFFGFWVGRHTVSHPRKKKQVAIKQVKPAKAVDVMPRMPLLPTANGPLDNDIFVIDPGHGGSDGGASLTVKVSAKNRLALAESAITYRAAWELAEWLRTLGGTVYLTAFSGVMLLPQENAQDRLWKPEDALYTATRKPMVSWQAGGIRPRTALARAVWEKYRSSKHIHFISVHTDSMPTGWKGGHVCVDDSTHPRDAAAVAKRFTAMGLERRHNGKPVRPLDERGLLVLRGNANPIPERMLVELGTASDSNDSYRLRDPARRRILIGAIVDSILATNERGN